MKIYNCALISGDCLFVKEKLEPVIGVEMAQGLWIGLETESESPTLVLDMANVIKLHEHLGELIRKEGIK